MKEIINTLKNLWLNENEIKVYIANLQLGIAQVSTISRVSEIKRTSMYGILKKMEEKKLVKKHIKNDITYYEAISPEELFVYFKKHLENLEKNIEQLKALNNQNSQKPQVYYYEWVEQVAKLYEIEVKQLPKEVKVFSANVDRKKWKVNQLRKIRNDIYKKIWDEKRPYMELILNRPLTSAEKKWWKFNWKYISPEKLNLEVSIKIYGDIVSFVSMKDEINWLVIKNKYIANTMKNIFDYVYENID